MQQNDLKIKGVTFEKIGVNQEGQRLDNFLMRILKGVPKSKIYKIIRAGEVRVNKKRAKPSQKLVLKDLVRVPPVLISEKKENVVPSGLKQRLLDAIVYQDKQFIVLDKPAGMAVHGGSGLSFGVIESIRAAMEQSQLELAHRLDKDTSGCLLVVKQRKALVEIHNSLRLKQVRKRYLALLAHPWQGPKQRVIDAPLLKNTLQGGERIVQVCQDGKEAKTMFQLVENFKHCCLVSAYPVTGRTHQIRVHAQSMGQPIIGDKKYGAKPSSLDNSLIKAPRLFLHANQLSFDWQPQAHFFEVPPDKQWQNFIQNLEL